jgi:hypothetical protein
MGKAAYVQHDLACDRNATRAWRRSDPSYS